MSHTKQATVLCETTELEHVLVIAMIHHLYEFRKKIAWVYIQGLQKCSCVNPHGKV